MKKDLLTIRQFLFLQWLYTRREGKVFCDTSHTDIQCFNCLDHNKNCQKGLIPASFFSKKVGRQYYDCKRVLDSLKKRDLIEELHYSGIIFHVFYHILPKGVEFFEKFQKKYWIT
ncbi:MAG: hypothetical protein ACTSYI_00035 [Promethearchaeota archaeon]